LAAAVFPFNGSENNQPIILIDQSDCSDEEKGLDFKDSKG
jgi:hypothetical protein